MAFADNGLVGWSGAWTWEVVSLLILKQVDQTPTQRKESTHQAMQSIQKFSLAPGRIKLITYISVLSKFSALDPIDSASLIHSFIHFLISHSLVSLLNNTLQFSFYSNPVILFSKSTHSTHLSKCCLPLFFCRWRPLPTLTSPPGAKRACSARAETILQLMTKTRTSL